jgi:predicted NBD/HSP70 family sugar kinase
MFNYNQYNLLNHLLAYGPTSRKNLAKILKISTAAVTMSVSYLIEDGIVYEAQETISGKAGRKEILIDINPDYSYALGMDIKDHYIRFSSCDLKGNVKYAEIFITVDEAVDCVKEYIKGKSILGMSVLVKDFISELDNQAFDKSIFYKLEKLDVKISYINNVEALGILHKYYFYHDNNYLLVKYGSGVGSAICVNNHLLNNSNISNDELGRVLINDNGYHELEELISYQSLDDFVNDDNIIEYLLTHREKLNKLEEYMCLAIVNTTILLSLDKVILAGKIFINEMIFDEFEKKINDIRLDVEVVAIDNYEDKRLMVGSIVTIYNELMNSLD